MTTEPPQPLVGELVLRGQPGVPPDLLAYAQPRPDGQFDTDRKGRPKVRRVRLRREHDDGPPQRPDGLLTDAQWHWATSTPRRWTSIVRKFGIDADHIAIALTRAGCVSLEHDYRDGAIQQPPRGWTPDPHFTQQHSNSRDAHHQALDQLHQHAHDLARELTDDWPGVATALTTPISDTRLVWLVRAAADLADGRVHDSARAFVQVHAGHTKARDNLPRLLADAGFEPAAITQLGVSRSPYIGLGGPIRAHRPGGHIIDFTGFPGPHDLRLPPDQTITIDLGHHADTLLIIENRQAAEAICDYHPHLPLVWCRGQPAEAVLRLINQAARDADQVVICPDADLGGIRIAARIHDHLPPTMARTVVDIGASEHTPGAAFNAHAITQISRITDRADTIGAFARACLDRGHAIEQEAPARAALRQLLASAAPPDESSRTRGAGHGATHIPDDTVAHDRPGR